MTIYLYVKTHNITGLKYLGQTIQHPYTYKGSGTYWKRHIKKYGNNVTTKILGTYNNKKDIKEAGLYYSRLWNVAESEEWANLMEENGDGSGKHSFEAIQNMRKPKSPEHIEKMRLWRRKPTSKKTKEKLRQTTQEIELKKFLKAMENGTYWNG